MELKELYLKAKSRFKNAGFDSPEIETKVLLLHKLGIEMHEVYSRPEKYISEVDCEKFEKSVERRLGGEPSAYICGVSEFFSMDFYVNSDVLIPRPDTELLVEQSIELLRKMRRPDILDIGTGSGCVAVSINKEIKAGILCASDISFNALETAEINSARNPGKNKIQFINCNMLESFKSSSFDIIISNPPYISKEDFSALQREVKDFEPSTALVSGEEGLLHISEIICDSTRALKQNGWCILEIGYDQSGKVEGLFKENGYKNVEIKKDINGIKRVIRGQWKR